MKNIFRNKLFITLFLFLIIVLLFFNNSFASFDFSYSGNIYILPDLNFDVYDYPYYFIVNYSNTIFLCFYDTEFLVGSYSDNLCVYNSSGRRYTSHLTDKNSWSSIKPYSCSLGNGTFYLSDVIYSSVDLKDSDGNVVFQGAPVVEQVTIPTITQAEEIPQVIQQVLKVMIPIGLIVLFSGLVIYLVRLVILRMT